MPATPTATPTIELEDNRCGMPEFIARRGTDWCRFTVLPKHEMQVLSFGGSVWPSSFPEFFDHVGPDRDAITARSGPQLNAEGKRLVELLLLKNAEGTVP